jgi:hypothetical protein
MHILNACNVHVVFYANAHETNTKDRCTQKDVDIEDYIWFTKSVLLIRLKERKEKDETPAQVLTRWSEQHEIDLLLTLIVC